MNLLRPLLFLFTLISSTINTFSQIEAGVSFRQFDTRSGLPSTQVQGIFEDSKGYIWAITDRGASRYDGYEFKTFTTRNGLPTNNVLLINEDHENRIWFMCNTGEYCYLKDDSAHVFGGNSRIKSLLKDKLPGPFYFDDHDTMWVTSFSGIQLFKCYGDSVQEYTPQVSSNENPTYYLRKVGEKLITLQVGDVTPENRISTNDNISYLLNVAGECKLACSVQVSENLWAVAGPGGFVIFDEKANLKAYFESSPYLFSTLEHDRSGNLWLTNSNGAYRLRDYNNGPSDADVYFEGHFITAVLQDKNGNYWFGDRDNGLFFVPVLDLKVFSTGIAGKQNKTISIKTNQDKIYFSDASGQVYQLIENEAVPLKMNQVPSGVSLDFVFTARGNVITGNKPYLVNAKTGKSELLDEKSTIRKSITAKNGTCVFALADGLGFLDQNEKWSRTTTETFKERSNCVHEDEHGAIWIGTNNGLWKYDGTSYSAVEELSTLKLRIAEIITWNGWLVCATRNAGIVFYKEGQVIKIGEEEGLISDMTDCVVSDHNNIWVGTASGVQHLTVESLATMNIHFKLISDQKGLPSNEVNDIFLFEDKLFVATNNGICVLNPNSAALPAKTTETFIHRFEVNGKPALAQHPELSWNENTITISYNSLYYRTAEKTRYRYKLEGLFSHWIESTSRKAEFPALPAGAYTFIVSSMNEDGDWGSEASMSFHISPHYSQTTWFRALVVILVLMIATIIFYFIYRGKKQQLENRAKMSELRQQALNANMNPHFIFNALGSIQHFINTGKGQEANEYLSDFSRLIRMNLETNQQLEVSLEDELERLELYLKLEKLRFDDQLNYQIQIDEDLNKYELMIPPMLLQPYVENALLHGILPSEHTGNLHIHISGLEEGYYQISIIDNGIGLHASQKRPRNGHKSLALAMNKERLQILEKQNGKKYEASITDLSNDGENKTGTCVRLVLPSS